MSAARAIVAEAAARRVELGAADGEIFARPPGALPVALRQEICRHKSELLELLAPGGGTRPPPASVPELLCSLRAAGVSLHLPPTLLGEGAGRFTEEHRPHLEQQGFDIISEHIAARPAGRLPAELRAEVQRRAGELQAVFDEPEDPEAAPPAGGSSEVGVQPAGRPPRREPSAPERRATGTDPRPTSADAHASGIEWLRNLLASGRLTERGSVQLAPHFRVIDPRRFTETLVRDLKSTTTAPLRRAAALRETQILQQALEQ